MLCVKYININVYVRSSLITKKEFISQGILELTALLYLLF